VFPLAGMPAIMHASMLHERMLAVAAAAQQFVRRGWTEVTACKLTHAGTGQIKTCSASVTPIA
jgi:hypothetical protein